MKDTGNATGDLTWVAERLDYTMFVVTAAANGTRAGCLVGFTTQCSIDPLRFLVLLSKKNRTLRVAEEADALGVHLVPEDRLDLAELFGGETGDDVDKFEHCRWHHGPLGVPVIEGCPSWFEGRIAGRFDAGDHVGFFLEPEEGDGGATEPLRFQDAKHIEPGHEP